MGTISIGDMSGREGPKYRMLADAISEKIADGELSAGEKLPPVRDLAWEVKVTPGTVARAYQWLTDRGLLVARVGSGTFVAQQVAVTAEIEALHEDVVLQVEPGIVDLRAPMLPDVGQVAQIRAAFQRVAQADSDKFLSYPDGQQSLPLRKLVLERKIKSFGTDGLTPDHVVITHGGQHAILTALQAVLRGAKPAVMTEELSYPGFRHAARQMRARVVSVAQDAEGPVPASIRAACQAHDVQVLATSAFAHNPTTITTSPQRRHEIVALAREFDFHIIDDQSYGLVRSDKPAYRDLAPERVWFISGVSKSIAPNLRLGWLITPDGREQIGQRVARHASFGVSFPILEATRLVLSDPKAEAIRQSVLRDNAARVAVMTETLGAFGIQTRPDIAYAYLPMPVGWRASTFTRAAEERDILIRNIDAYVLADGRAPNAVRLAVNGRVSLDSFRAACEVLRDLLSDPPHEMGV
ncbi:GntR family transcriptional regulator [Actibacterium atlanticum]|uniref:GntR family transcriptional regulator n=1 Tax=Actibacterium atlanticum TaxID=1461693 RepID=A0A058ZRZ9_9RHOB|nr:PLP-dependent aminotransferase family protein [Actibacterium atlanticum]KCV83616.1 GntR family transcriptional regulator [Actibacterium atlanticum]